MKVTVIELAEPAITGQRVQFDFRVTPETKLYERTGFHLSFPPTVDLAAVPPPLWWRIALICLHAHWPLLRPCRVVLPVRLPPGEAELWLRMTDAAVATLEARVDGSETARRIELVGSGPVLDWPELTPPARERDGVVACFSGVRDSIAQAAMLSELGEVPTLVTVTSPVAWSHEHEAAPRREAFEQIYRRRSWELVEVVSDLRGNENFTYDLRGNFEGVARPERYGVGVNELSDALLYLAAAIAVAAACGAAFAMIASEAEVQENAKRGGMVVQARHFMYSAVTHRAVSEAVAPGGVRVGSLTNSLRQFQVQRLLAQRYADLRDLQFSCWSAELAQRACSRCGECRRIAFNLIALDLTTALAGIDLSELLISHAEWSPGGNYLITDEAPEDLPSASADRAHEMQEVRCLVETTPQRVAALLERGIAPERRQRALEVYERLHAEALKFEVEPEPGYRAGYLELVDERLREPLRRILEQHFEPAPPETYAGMLRNTRLLADWICAPVRSAPESPVLDEPPAQIARPPDPITLSASQLESIATLIPDPEPQLEPGPDGRLLRVADTLLDGNERRYLEECIDTNWVSSTGSFVARLEQQFAAAVGCQFAVACSSGTAALHLALAAAGIAAGDEVIVPAFTMIASATSVIYTGGTPVLVDAEPRTWNIDPERVLDKLTPRTRALVAVRTYGVPAAIDELREIARRNGLVLIEDAAEAHGATYKGRPAGSLGDIAAFSLYGNKILTAGEGGLVTTNDERIAAVARELRDHAFSSERHFWHRRLGFNYRMTNLQAAVALAQVERFSELVALRAVNAQRYREALAGIEGVGLPPEQDGAVSWMFGITVHQRFGISRDELRRRLAARGVETRTFFVPLHLQPALYARFAGQRYPVAEQLGRGGLYLPSGPALRDEDIAYVAESVRASRVAGGSPISV